MRHRLELVVQVQLRAHEHEAEGVDSPNQGGQDPGVPGAVRLVLQSVERVAADAGEQTQAQVLHRRRVMLVRLGVGVACLVLELEPEGQQRRGARRLALQGDVHGLRELPELDRDADGRRGEHDERGVVVEQVEEDDRLFIPRFFCVRVFREAKARFEIERERERERKRENVG